MVVNDRDRFINGLMQLAKVCKTELSEWQMEAFTGIFLDIGFDKGIEALKHAFMKVRGNATMPSPYDLLEYVGIRQPEAPTNKDLGTEIAGKITEAIGRLGGYRAKKAAEELGPDIWRVVEYAGGWEALCMTDEDQLGTLRAQLRDLAQARIAISGHLPALEGGEKLVEGLLAGVTDPETPSKTAKNGPTIAADIEDQGKTPPPF